MSPVLCRRVLVPIPPWLVAERTGPSTSVWCRCNDTITQLQRASRELQSRQKLDTVRQGSMKDEERSSGVCCPISGAVASSPLC